MSAERLAYEDDDDGDYNDDDHPDYTDLNSLLITPSKMTQINIYSALIRLFVEIEDDAPNLKV